MRAFSKGTPINAARFSWSHGNGYAEASDLRELRMHQVWPDSCDEGFTIINQATGKTKTFVQFSEIRDREHELQASVFASINDRTGMTDRPALRLTITIYND